MGIPNITFLFIRTTLGYKVYYPLKFGYIGKNVGYFGYISVSYSKKKYITQLWFSSRRFLYSDSAKNYQKSSA